MKIMKILPILLVLPSVVFAASRGETSARVGMGRGSQAGARMSITAADVEAAVEKGVQTGVGSVNTENVKSAGNSEQETAKSVAVTSVVKAVSGSGDCRDAYRECMDSFCLLDESQGERCACSDNIDYAKSKIKAV
jgi:hypothetical protein